MQYTHSSSALSSSSVETRGTQSSSDEEEDELRLLLFCFRLFCWLVDVDALGTAAATGLDDDSDRVASGLIDLLGLLGSPLL